MDKSLRIIAEFSQKGLGDLDKALQQISKSAGKIGDAFKGISINRGQGGLGEFAAALLKSEKQLTKLGVTNKKVMESIRDVSKQAIEDQRKYVVGLNNELEASVKHYQAIKRNLDDLRAKGLSPSAANEALLRYSGKKVLGAQTNLAAGQASLQASEGGGAGGMAAILGMSPLKLIGIAVGAAITAFKVGDALISERVQYASGGARLAAGSQVYWNAQSQRAFGGDAGEALGNLDGSLQAHIAENASRKNVSDTLWGQRGFSREGLRAGAASFDVEEDKDKMYDVRGVSYALLNSLVNKISPDAKAEQKTHDLVQGVYGQKREEAVQLSSEEKAQVGNRIMDWDQRALGRMFNQMNLSTNAGSPLRRTYYGGEDFNMGAHGALSGSLGNFRGSQAFDTMWKLQGGGIGPGASASMLGGLTTGTGGSIGGATAELERIMTRAYVAGIRDPQARQALGQAVSEGTATAYGRQNSAEMTGQILGNVMQKAYGDNPDTYGQQSTTGALQDLDKIFGGGGTSYFNVGKGKMIAGMLTKYNAQSSGFDALDTSMLNDVNMTSMMSGQLPDLLRDRMLMKFGGDQGKLKQFTGEMTTGAIDTFLMQMAEGPGDKKALTQTNNPFDALGGSSKTNMTRNDIVGFMVKTYGMPSEKAERALDIMELARTNGGLTEVQASQLSEALASHGMAGDSVHAQNKAAADSYHAMTGKDGKKVREAYYQEKEQQIDTASDRVSTAINKLADRINTASAHIHGGPTHAPTPGTPSKPAAGKK